MQIFLLNHAVVEAQDAISKVEQKYLSCLMLVLAAQAAKIAYSIQGIDEKDLELLARTQDEKECVGVALLLSHVYGSSEPDVRKALGTLFEAGCNEKDWVYGRHVYKHK
ncbi:hypothetical protein HY485_04250 [Candidatus Woesearchaeota archaeon]|nr:hypothetical protein [Candidatus Woesearchaeota archaeon]